MFLGWDNLKVDIFVFKPSYIIFFFFFFSLDYHLFSFVIELEVRLKVGFEKKMKMGINYCWLVWMVIKIESEKEEGEEREGSKICIHDKE